VPKFDLTGFICIFVLSKIGKVIKCLLVRFRFYSSSPSQKVNEVEVVMGNRPRYKMSERFLNEALVIACKEVGFEGLPFVVLELSLHKISFN